MYLNCHTHFSFRYGTLSPQELFDEARRCGVTKIVLTEINNTTSYVEMLRICEDNRRQHDGLNKLGGEGYDLELVVGIDFRNGAEQLYVAIAKNDEGFEELNRFLSVHNATGSELPGRAPRFENAFVIYPSKTLSPDKLLPHEYVGVRWDEVHQLAYTPLYSDYRDRFVILQSVTFANKVDHNIHRLLRAIDKNVLLSKLPAHEQALEGDVMIHVDELIQRLQQFPFLLENTIRLIDSCVLEIALAEDKNLKCVTGGPEEDWTFLVSEAWKGFQERYDVDEPSLKERFDRELRIIRVKGFVAYYLIAYDLIRFAKDRGFDYVGRGSGANSLVAYCLGITNVDPIELDLYFERFLNEERSSPPDFDIDFSWDNRDAIYEYLFTRYGRDHVCLLGTHVTFQERALIRELGKVFGLPRAEIEALAENPEKVERRDNITELILKYGRLMKDMPSHLSIHAGGVLITEKPIFSFTSTALPSKGYQVSHLEMHSAEDIGIFKFDILSQRGLGHLKEAVRLVKRNRNEDVDIKRFRDFIRDDKVRTLLSEGRTMGCFYVESPAMRMLLAKLRCQDYKTLVAASSIIRPGVASSGMMKTYIERFHATQRGEVYESIHPFMDELMAETFGVMVYQEDVIKVAHHFAGLTLTEADVLRRGMSGKYRSRHEFQRIRSRFFSSCKSRGYPDHVVERVWFEIESFSGYSFAKGHSASYAVESYQSLYLKAYYPLEFMVGVINNFGGFYQTEFYFHEARMLGGVIEGPCINRSNYLTTVFGNEIIVGFIHLKNFEKRVAEQLVCERQQRGMYRDIEDFLSRVPMGLEQIRILIRVGALRCLEPDKQRLMWKVMLYLGRAKTKRPSADLFPSCSQLPSLPRLERKAIEDSFDEIELIGFPLRNPFDLVENSNIGNCTGARLRDSIGDHVHILGYLVTLKDTRTRSAQRMHFGTFLDREGSVFDTVHFPDVAAKHPFRGRGFYSIYGRVVDDFGVQLIEVSRLEKVPMISPRADEMMRETPGERQGLVHL